MKKIVLGIAAVLLLAACGQNPSTTPSENPSAAPSETASEVVSEAAPSEPASEQESVFVAPENAYKVTFTIDENIEKILIFADQDYSKDPFDCEQELITYSRNDENGEYTKYVEGVEDPDTQEIVGEIKPQVNFKVVCKDGYEAEVPTFEGDAKNVKAQTDGIFRVTVIKGDITVSCTSKAVGAEEDLTGALEVKFNCTHCHVVVWKTEKTGDDAAAILDLGDHYYSRNKTSGVIAKEGDEGQIYFKVVCDEGYVFAPACLAEGEASAANVDFITGTYNKCKYNAETGIYNLTKINSEIVITLTAVAA